MATSQICSILLDKEKIKIDTGNISPDSQCRSPRPSCTGARTAKGCTYPGTQGCYGRSAGTRDPANLRLPEMRCSNEHRRNPGAQTAYSCAASAGRCAMSKRTWQTSNPLPLLHREEPIRERLACCVKSQFLGLSHNKKTEVLTPRQAI